MVVAVPLLMVYMRLNLNDNNQCCPKYINGLPFMVLLGASVFATIPEEFEEAEW